MTNAELKESIENFLSMTGVKPYRFGVEAMGDPNFVFEIRKGRRCYGDTAKRIKKYMREYLRKNHGKTPNKPQSATAAE